MSTRAPFLHSSFVLFTGLALFALEFLGSILSDTSADTNPRGAATGEWSATPDYDFNAKGGGES